MERERRMLGELRASTDGPPTLTGYAALFDTEAVIAGMFREQVAPGAFDSALKRKDDVRALFNHDPNVVLGRTGAGTLTLSVDKRGLRYDVVLPDTQAARDLYTSVQRGDISQSSFGFRVTKDEWPTRDSGDTQIPLRIIRDVELFDVSPVTYPAYDDTSVSARAKAQAEESTARELASQDASLRADLRARLERAERKIRVSAVINRS